MRPTEAYNKIVFNPESGIDRKMMVSWKYPLWLYKGTQWKEWVDWIKSKNKLNN